MISHNDINPRTLVGRIKRRQINFAGNKKLRNYGLLTCSSGKRMKKENRVFFFDEHDAAAHGFRPCGHCLKKKYNIWKTSVLP